MQLSERDRALLGGEGNPAQQLSMKLIVAVAEALGAAELLDISGAHIDSCLYHGRAGLDFAERLVAGGGAVSVPTTLNVTSLDLLHPELARGDTENLAEAQRLIAAYEALGGRPTWTCAPYQLEARPGLGDQVAWGESNAIVFANSVLGARTERYGDFTDIAAAIVGRAPAAGLHLDEGRRGGIVFDLQIPDDVAGSDVLYPVLGHLIGYRSGRRVPVISGLAHSTEDQLKALGAGAASSGAVAMFHAVGVTPEAPTLADVASGDIETVTVTMDDLRHAAHDLSHGKGELGGVALGTPHASADELAEILELLDGSSVAAGLACSVNTSRDVLAETGLGPELERLGVDVVTDTCTYLKPIMDVPRGRAVMTNSAKWAYYAPANIGVDVVFGSTADCVATAVRGEVTRVGGWWS